MEDFDTTKIIAGVAVGAAVMTYLLAPKSNSSTEKASAESVEIESAAVSKKKKKAQKKKEKTAALKQAVQKITASEAAKVEKENTEDKPLSKAQKKRIAKKERESAARAEEAKIKAEAEKAAAAAAGVDGGKKKKKKKKKKTAEAAAAVVTAAVPLTTTAPEPVVQAVVEEHNDDEGWSVVEVKKPKKKVVKKTEDTKEAEPASEPGTVVELQRKELSAVIGSGGKNIQHIQLVSGAKVNIPKDGEGETRMCTITGNPEQILMARELVLEYAEHGGPKPECSVPFVVNNRDANLIVGEKGSNIRKLQSDLNIRIDVSKVNKEAANVIVSGTRDDVSKAIIAIKAFISSNNLQKMIQLEGDRAVQAMFGEKGARKKEIQEVSKAWVEILKLERCVKLLGTQEQVDKAAAMVIQTIEEEKGPPKLAKGQVYEKINAGGATGQIVGSGGKTIQNIQEKSGATVELKDDSTCYVYGKPEAVAKAFGEIKDIVSRYEENMTRLKNNPGAASIFGGAAGAAATSTGWDVPEIDARWGASTFVIPNNGGVDGWGNIEAVAAAW